MITGTEAEYQSGAASTKDTPYLAQRAGYEVSFENICEKIDCIITAPHCILSKHWKGLR